jgi:hypothetical protein
MLYSTIRIAITVFGVLDFVVTSGFVHPFRTTRLHRHRDQFLKSTKENEEIADEGTKSRGSKSKDTDIPAWLKPLLKRDQSTSNREKYDEPDEKLFDSFPFSIGKDRKSKIWESEMSPVVASLSGMINVEALMAAANITTDLGPEENAQSAKKVPSSEDFTFENETGLSQIDTSVLSDALSFLDGSLRWDKFMQIQKKNETPREFDTVNNVNIDLGSDDFTGADNYLEASKSSDVDKILGEATKRLEYAVNSVSSTLSPTAIQDLVVRASKTLALREASGNLTLAAKIVFDGASKAPRATAKYTAELIEFANTTLARGMKPLFKNYPTARTVSSKEWRQVVKKGAEYGAISGAIYENTIPNTHNLGHSIIAQGKTSDIAWMITDSIQLSQDFDGRAKEEPFMVRSFIFRGFDASDEGVDREALLNAICA